MTEQQFTDEYAAAEADAAEQLLSVDADGRADVEERLPEPEAPVEADPADAAEQAVSVPVDDDEYR